MDLACLLGLEPDIAFKLVTAIPEFDITKVDERLEPVFGVLSSDPEMTGDNRRVHNSRRMKESEAVGLRQEPDLACFGDSGTLPTTSHVESSFASPDLEKQSIIKYSLAIWQVITQIERGTSLFNECEQNFFGFLNRLFGVEIFENILATDTSEFGS